jgi:hypothetical protein
MTATTYRHTDCRSEPNNLRLFDRAQLSTHFPLVDPFEGKVDDPQSLHKYAYVHGDPIQGNDPSGQFLIAGLVGGILGASYGRSQHAAAITPGYSLALRTAMWATIGSGVSIFGAFAVNNTWGYAGAPANDPQWVLTGSRRPEFSLDWATEHAGLFEANIEAALTKVVDERGGNPTEVAESKAAAGRIAKAYVSYVKQNARDGRGGIWQSVVNEWFDRNHDDTAPSCRNYCAILDQPLSQAAIGSKWVVRVHGDSRKFGDALYWYTWPVKTAFRHSYMSVTYQPAAPTGAAATQPDWILDPWQYNRPDIFIPDEQFYTWPLP